MRLGDSPLAKSEKQVLQIGNMLNALCIVIIINIVYMFGVVRFADDIRFVVSILKQT